MFLVVLVEKAWRLAQDQLSNVASQRDCDRVKIVELERKKKTKAILLIQSFIRFKLRGTEDLREKLDAHLYLFSKSNDKLKEYLSTIR